MRTNITLNLGNFEVDWPARRVFFRLCNLFASEEPPPKLLALMVHTAVAETDRLAPILRELCGTPAEELERLDVGRLLRRSLEG